jgi:hypothetical protein
MDAWRYGLCQRHTSRRRPAGRFATLTTSWSNAVPRSRISRSSSLTFAKLQPGPASGSTSTHLPTYRNAHACIAAARRCPQLHKQNWPGCLSLPLI